MLEAGSGEVAGGPAAEVVAAAVEQEIELTMTSEAAALLARRPGLAREGVAKPVTVVWYDDPEASLARRNVILERRAGAWEMQALAPDEALGWPAVMRAPVLGRGPSPATLEPSPPFDAAPVAAFEGKERRYRGDGVGVLLVSGTLRGVLQSTRASRLRLRGPAAALDAAVEGLVDLPVAVPRASFAREALAAARGERLPPRRLGLPSLRAGVPVSDGLAVLLSDLLDAMLHWTDRFRAAPAPEAVHQARVATRRLRSALATYRPAAGCEAVERLAATLRDCAARLGAARDWDVFLAGTGARLAEGATGDARLLAMLRAARRRRDTAYAALGAYLDSAEFRRLELGLGMAAALRPWERAGTETLGTPTEIFAAAMLSRRLKRVRRRGKQLAALPVEELHELRKDCKKLRYAIEFFASLFPKASSKPLLKRLTQLQDELGLLNDSATAGQLMGQLGRAGRGYAGGLVEGWAAAEAVPARGRVAAEWRKFKQVAPFWTA